MAILFLAGYLARGKSHTGGVRGLSRCMIPLRVLVRFIGVYVFWSMYSLPTLPLATASRMAKENDRYSRSEPVAVTTLHHPPGSPNPSCPGHRIISSEIHTALRRRRLCDTPIPAGLRLDHAS